MLKKVLKTVAILLAVALVVVLGYVAYVFISYHRLPDMETESPFPYDADREALAVGTPCRIVTWNLGFGAYSDDFGFFMDGGTESRARSKDELLGNLGHAAEVLDGLEADFMLLQEVDVDATRSYHVDEVALIEAAFPDYGACLALNYDSPYLFYPITKPHGASKAGIVTLSRTAVSRFARISLPIESGFRKFLDLDRCYSKSWIPVANDRYLVLYNLHLSAYTADSAIATEQLRLLLADMKAEYEAGNWAVAGGDFNKDVSGDSAEAFGFSAGEYSWAQPLERSLIPDGLSLVDPLDRDAPVPSCRNADGPYVKGESFVLVVDGFVVSDNVRVADCRLIDEGFACSDHNPVLMHFELTEDVP